MIKGSHDGPSGVKKLKLFKAGRNLLLVLSGWSQCNYGFEVRQVMKASSVQEGVNNGT